MAEGFRACIRSSASLSQTSASERNNNSVDSSLSNMNSNRSGLFLPLSSVSQMAIPIYTSPSMRDVELGGRVLFQNFIHEELEHERLPEDVIQVDNPPPEAFEDIVEHTPSHSGDAAYASPEVSPALLSTPEGFTNSQFISIGANIRNIADQFAVSHERIQIREEADGVNLKDITYTAFRQMLTEVFVNGIDKFRIVALFYFCSDVLIRCARAEMTRLGSKLFFWALDFLVAKVCRWVYDHGGWERVFSNIYNVTKETFKIVALGVFIVCGIIYVRKNFYS